MNMKEKDRQILSKVIKYFACVLTVIFAVKGVVDKFVSPKNPVPQTEEKPKSKTEQKTEISSDANWVDQVIESDEEIFEIPVTQMSELSSTDNQSAEEIFQKINVAGKRKKFLDAAKKYLGVPYVYGGADKNGMDCSGLVYQSAKDGGLGTLPKSSGGLFEKTVPINQDQAQPGDLVFFMRDGKIFHVAIYLGGNKIVHSISDTKVPGVDVSDLDEKFWKEHLHGFGKIEGIDN